jgi:hypothetical protein
LSESLAQYEQGVKLLRQCFELLAQAERKIEILAGIDAAGNPVTEPFLDEAGDSLEVKQASRSRRRSQKETDFEAPTEDDGLDDIPF